MHVFYDLAEVQKNNKTVVTLGTFDGLHLGHQKIIKTVVDKASGNGGRSFLITFEPHPRNIISKDYKLELLTTINEKTELLNKLGVENLLVINFTKEFSQLSPEQFIKNYLVDGLGASSIIIGYDHHFGKGRGGDAATIKELGSEYHFDATTVEPFKLDDEIVSSTKIRSALKDGNLAGANKMLGRYYSFSGTVVSGDKRGRQLGFPTANIKLDEEKKLLPSLGIYLVEFIVDAQKHFGLLSIGKRPTFYNSGSVVPEVYIYDFNADIYGKHVTVNMVARIRGEEKYSSPEKLIEQMNIDKKNGLLIIKKISS
ncbi:MAG: bifunctional riboflavin kinase/FAD synthetase [Ignavibacteriaceae bacterium]|nr:bifunctional riboflavin kinase/FAD synthetase [Ignavibacteriaceae bacterium]